MKTTHQVSTTEVPSDSNSEFDPPDGLGSVLTNRVSYSTNCCRNPLLGAATARKDRTCLIVSGTVIFVVAIR